MFKNGIVNTLGKLDQPGFSLCLVTDLLIFMRKKTTDTVKQCYQEQRLRINYYHGFKSQLRSLVSWLQHGRDVRYSSSSGSNNILYLK